MIRYKEGVRTRGISAHMALAASTVDHIYEDFGQDECWIVSGNDGRHSDGSLHYCGEALDFRTRDVPEAQRAPLAAKVREALGDQFDVVLEATHLHVEYDPR